MNTSGYSGWSSGIAGLFLSMIASVSLAQGASAPWVATSVHGYRFALAVESVLESAPVGVEPRHARVIKHRLLVSIREEASGRPAPVVSVSADAAERGYNGVNVPLAPVRSGEEMLFEGRATFTRSPYRILVHATPAAGGRTLEAHFYYRHHH